MLQRLADAIILCPSKNEIRVEHKTRTVLRHTGGEIDLWVQHRGGAKDKDPEVFVLKFGGTGSRAERATMHPLDFWDEMAGEIWAPNWPGFGTTRTRASLPPLFDVGVHCYEEIRKAADGRPVVITGNSLGTSVALAVAAKYRDMAALILRNPPPLRQLIVGKHGWYSFGVGAWLISRYVPKSLDSIANARGSDVPALFVTSGKDRMVPPAYQRMIFDAYAGPKQCMLLADADHSDFPAEHEVEPYRQQLQWLRERAGLTAGRRVSV